MKTFSFFRGSLRLRLIALFSFFALLCMVLFNVFDYFMDERIVVGEMKSRIVDCATLIAWQFSSADLDSIRAPSDKAKPEFKRLQSLLDKTRRESVSISNIYIFRLSPEGKLAFVVDESAKDGHESAEVGELVADEDGAWAKHASSPETAKTPFVDDFISHDRFGDWLSGFAPIFDANGKVSACLGVDIAAKAVSSAKLELLRESFWRFLTAFPFAVLLGWFFGGWMAARLLLVRESLEKMRSLDFTGDVKAKSHDEFGELVDSFNATKSQLKDAMGKLEASSQELERKSSILRQFIDSMPYPVFCKDSQGRYIECNDSFCVSFARMPRELVIGNTVNHFMAFINPPLHESMDNAVLSGQRKIVSYESSFKTPEGDERSFIIYKAVFKAPDGSISGLVGALIDITERHRMEDELRKARAKADDASFAKSRFLANISHEIRTPLNGMIGAVELFRESVTDKRQIDLLDTMEESGRMLVSIMSDILDLAKIESGKISLEEVPCNLNDILRSMDKVFKSSAQKKGICPKLTLMPEDVAWVYCDPTRLKQVIANLLGNALKFTDSGVIELKAERTSERQLDDGPFFYRFSVKDSGVGVAPDKKDLIFEAFSQEDVSTTRRFGGYGLGLSICKHLVMLMGGSINVESEKGKGSLFHFEIPLKDACSDLSIAQELPVSGKVDANGLRVLIVDDHVPSVKIARGILEGFGCQCSEAYSCKDALVQIERERFDAVLLDLAMPDGAGHDVACKIREHERSCLLKPSYIVAVTANSMCGGKERCLQSGMDDFLLKPITKSLLAAVIQKALKRDG